MYFIFYFTPWLLPVFLRNEFQQSFSFDYSFPKRINESTDPVKQFLRKIYNTFGKSVPEIFLWCYCYFIIFLSFPIGLDVYFITGSLVCWVYHHARSFHQLKLRTLWIFDNLKNNIFSIFTFISDTEWHLQELASRNLNPNIVSSVPLFVRLDKNPWVLFCWKFSEVLISFLWVTKIIIHILQC